MESYYYINNESFSLIVFRLKIFFHFTSQKYTVSKCFDKHTMKNGFLQRRNDNQNFTNARKIFFFFATFLESTYATDIFRVSLTRLQCCGICRFFLQNRNIIRLFFHIRETPRKLNIYLDHGKFSQLKLKASLPRKCAREKVPPQPQKTNNNFKLNSLADLLFQYESL